MKQDNEKKRRQAPQGTHCFAICAYKDSPYLENCIRSLKAQTVKTEILLATSTPSGKIRSLAEKYGIPCYVREGESDIQADWNFAYDQAQAEYVTIAHQDDEYDPEYAKELLTAAEKYGDISLFLSDYLPIKNGQVGKRDINSRIRRLLRTPLKWPFLADKRWVKKAVLCLGNSICCPAVTYHKGRLGAPVFTSEYKYNLDWDTFYKYACLPGRFAYVDKPLTHYRVHDGATSKEFIEDHRRVADDISMFQKFWPRWVVRLLMVFYKNAYKTYD
ncbi:MAG: glycosyltransferase family 2 protein [Lachnospiraceae bacterium]|jgi:glycosyltransferase involved in cell wall biosynthesis|nr:glycosyltransferase family 2 protein [Lachnospiraceae bacterium]